MSGRRAMSLADGCAFAQRWFRVAFVLFAIGSAAGLLFAAFGPVPFIRVLGNMAAAAGALGMLVALAGRRLAATRAVQPAPIWVEPPPSSATEPRSAVAVEASTSERLPVWPGVTQPV